MVYYNYRGGTKKGKEVSRMDKIEKALKELQEAVKTNDTITSVRVTITITKPKPDRAKPKTE